jgi:methionine synthase I (cobalamin-dependent)
MILAPEGAVVVADGALGTLALARRPGLAGPSALWTLEHPDLVLSIHRDYVAAGAGLLVTNTFLASRAWLPDAGPSVAEVNRAAVALARRAAGHRAAIAGSVGPVRAATFDFAVSVYAEQIAALVGAGVDAVLLETMPALEPLVAALTAARSTAAGVPVIASMTLDGGARASDGASPADLAAAAERFGAAAVGANCSEGPASVLEAMRELSAATRLPLVARPSAGLPDLSVDAPVYPVDAAEMAVWARRLAAAGASVVGGCCGTTPATVRAMAVALAEIDPPAYAGRSDAS